MQKNFMNKFRFRLYLMINGALVLTVIALFKMIPEKKIAALCAGMLFILVPSSIIFSELKIFRARFSWTLCTAVLFLLTSALPVLLLRVTHWQEPFEKLQLLGFTGPQWHQFANYIFLVMLLGNLVDSLRARIQADPSTL